MTWFYRLFRRRRPETIASRPATWAGAKLLALAIANATPGGWPR